MPYYQPPAVELSQLKLGQQELKTPLTPLRQIPIAMPQSSLVELGLGLTKQEVLLLRQGQMKVAQSRASSSASSASSSMGLLILDETSLSALGMHFDRSLQRVQEKLEDLMEKSTVATMHIYDRAGNLIDNTDVEIARYHNIMRQIDELELDFDRIARIRDIVKEFRHRAEALESELDRTAPSKNSEAELSSTLASTSFFSDEGTGSSSAGLESSSAGSDRSWTSAQKEKAIDRAMTRFVRWLDYRITVYNWHMNHDGNSTPSGSAATSSRPESSDSNQNQQETSPKSSKRQQQHQDSQDIEQPGEEEDNGDGQERQQKRAKVDDSMPKKLACPFFKRDSRKYQFWRACPGPGWDTVHRVK